MSSTKSKKSKKLKQSCISFLPAANKNITPTLVPKGESSKLDTKSEKKIKDADSTKMVKSNKIKNSKAKLSSANKVKLKEVIRKQNSSSKVKVNGTSKSTKSKPILLSDDEEDVPLSKLKDKIMTPTKKSSTPTKVVLPPNASASNITKTLNNSPIKSVSLSQVKLTASNIQKLLPSLNITNAQQKPNTPIGAGVIPQALQSLSNSIKVPIKSPVINGQQVLLMPTKPLQVQPKNLIIAIDMDPEQWKKLPLAEQQKIIAQKRAQLNKTQQQLITIAIKKPPTPIVPGQRVLLNSASGSIGPQKPKISFPNKPLVQPPGMPTGSLLPKSGGPIANSGTYSFTDLISEKKHESEVSGLRPLPKLKKVHLPESLEYKSFGSILMITEFVDIFKGFLMTDENFPIKTDEIIEAVSQKKESETVLKILLYFLKVLLGNECYKIKSLKIELADLPLTEFTVSFLVEQFLKSYIDKKKKQKQAEEMAAKYSKITESGEDTETDMDGDDEPFEPPTDEPIFLDSEDEDEYYGYSLKPKQSKKKKKPKGTLTRYMIEENRTLEKVTNISKFLEKSEFHHLPPDHQIETLAFLMQLVMDSEEFLNYHEEIARDRMDAIRDLELYRRKKREEYVAKHPTPSTQTLPINKFMVNPTIKEPQANKIVVNLDGTVKEKPKNEEAKKDDQEKKDVKDEASKDEKKTDNEEKKDEKIEEKKDEKIEEKKDEKIEEKKDEKIEEKKEDDDLYAGMTERQIQAIKDEAKKAEMDKMEKLKEDLEKERLELDELKRKIKVATDLCNDAQRIEPLGYDRHDRSYWLFSRNNPGIYVSSLALWYIIDNGETIKDLTSALTVRGIREDRLKRALLRLQPEIKESIQVLKESGTSILKDDFKDMQSKGCSISVIKNDGTRTIYGKTDVDRSSDSDGDKPLVKSVEKIDESKENNKVVMKSIKETDTSNDISSSKDAETVKEKITENGSIKDSEKEESENTKSDSVDKDGEPIKMETDLNETNEVNGVINKKEINDSTNKLVKSTEKSSDDASDKKNENADSKLNGDVKTSKEPEKASSIATAAENKSEIKTDTDKKSKSKGSDFPTSIEALKADIFESSERIVQGTLGQLKRYDEWTASLTAVEETKDLKTFIIDLQKSVFEKSFLSPFKGFDPAFVKEWLKSVEQAETLSKLHTLYGILENSISWEKSSETLKCNACRRKQGVRNSTPMVICDGCQNAYHMNCIRPPLLEVPESVWICPRCVPKEDRRGRRKVAQSYNEQLDSSQQSIDDTEASDHEDACHVCGADGMVILCDTCPLSFHFQCHDPPLRRAPKGAWSCYVCRKNFVKKNTEEKEKKKKKAVGENASSESSESENDSEAEFQLTTHYTNKLKKTKNNDEKSTKNTKKSKSSIKKSQKKDTVKESTPDPETNVGRKGRKRKAVSYDERVTDDGDESDLSSRGKNNKTGVGKKRKKKTDGDEEWTASSAKGNSSLNLGIKRPMYSKDRSNDKERQNVVAATADSASSDVEKPTTKKKRSQKNETKDTAAGTKPRKKNRRESNFELKACRIILMELRKEKDASHFQNPVSRRQFPTYYGIITNPMNLSNIMRKLDGLQYDNVMSFIDDVNLIFENCEKFYKETDNEVKECGARLKKKFTELLTHHLPGIAS